MLLQHRLTKTVGHCQCRHLQAGTLPGRQSRVLWQLCRRPMHRPHAWFCQLALEIAVRTMLRRRATHATPLRTATHHAVCSIIRAPRRGHRDARVFIVGTRRTVARALRTRPAASRAIRATRTAASTSRAMSRRYGGRAATRHRVHRPHSSLIRGHSALSSGKLLCFRLCQPVSIRILRAG